MTNNHPIAPSSELIRQWKEAPEFSALSPCVIVTTTTTKLQDIAIQAARWGSDQELEACCEWVSDNFDHCNSTGRIGSAPPDAPSRRA